MFVPDMVCKIGCCQTKIFSTHIFETSSILWWIPIKVDGEQAANLANFFDYGGILGGVSCGILNDKTSEWLSTLNERIPCQSAPFWPENCLVLHKFTHLSWFFLIINLILFREACNHMCYHADHGHSLSSPLPGACQWLVRLFISLVFRFGLPLHSCLMLI